MSEKAVCFMKKKLVKSSNVMLTGSLAGIAEYFKLDPTVVRVLFLLSMFFSFGTTIVLYIIIALIIPSAPKSTTQEPPVGGKRPRKEAEKVDDDQEWSDY